MKKLKIVFIFCILLIHISFAQQKIDFNGKTVHFTASDGVKITGDLYLTTETKAPFIILYHQAGYSRGEYREIAPKLNKLGFNCLAIDQRSGKEVNGIINETHLEAIKLNKPTQYVDAITDIEAAYLYVKHGIKPNKIFIWGSSYSAAVMFFLGSSHYNGLDGILAFSPGEYFKINGKEIKLYAQRVKCPVFITSAKSERTQWKSIYDSVKTDKKYFLPTSQGKHGSKALWMDNSDHQAYWNAVTDFLIGLK
jgi:dienelactone hydrolase